MKNGDTLETATVGLEGASWISASLGAPSLPCETVVAIAGDAHALRIDDLDREMKENVHFRDVLTQYFLVGDRDELVKISCDCGVIKENYEQVGR